MGGGKGNGKKISPSLIDLFYWTGFEQAQAGTQSHYAETRVEEKGNAYLEHLRSGHHAFTQHVFLLVTQHRTMQGDPSLGRSYNAHSKSLVR